VIKGDDKIISGWGVWAALASMTYSITLDGCTHVTVVTRSKCSQTPSVVIWAIVAPMSFVAILVLSEVVWSWLWQFVVVDERRMWWW